MRNDRRRNRNGLRDGRRERFGQGQGRVRRRRGRRYGGEQDGVQDTISPKRAGANPAKNTPAIVSRGDAGNKQISHALGDRLGREAELGALIGLRVVLHEHAGDADALDADRELPGPKPTLRPPSRTRLRANAPPR